MLTIFDWNFEVWAVQKYANLVDLVKSFPGDVGDKSKNDAGEGDDKDNRSGRGQKKPKDVHGKKEAKGAASKRGRKDSSGDQRIACKKVKPK